MSDPQQPPPGALGWIGVAVLCLCAALAAVLEALLVPLYAGSIVVPIAVVLALASNIALPRMARILVPSTLAAALPFAVWLLVIVVFGVVARPEGDVILPGGTDAVHWVSYGVMLGGALVGAITIVTSGPPIQPPGTRPRAAAPSSRVREEQTREAEQRSARRRR